jgi:hypothetical protein
VLRLIGCAAVLLIVAGCGSGSPRSGVPPGLTAYGRVVWNLDALLHDRFGGRPVYLNDGATTFSTKFVSEVGSDYYVYTFADAHHSRFRVLRPKRPPKTGTDAFGQNIPFTIAGAYISCGDGKWLYGRSGQDQPEGPMWCSRTPIAGS